MDNRHDMAICQKKSISEVYGRTKLHKKSIKNTYFTLLLCVILSHQKFLISYLSIMIISNRQSSKSLLHLLVEALWIYLVLANLRLSWKTYTVKTAFHINSNYQSL